MSDVQQKSDCPSKTNDRDSDVIQAARISHAGTIKAARINYEGTIKAACIGAIIIGVFSIFKDDVIGMPVFQPSAEITIDSSSSEKVKQKPHIQNKSISSYEKATLNVSGTGAVVKVTASNSVAPYSGGVISGVGIDSSISLPVGQELLIDVTGVGVDIIIDQILKDYVDVKIFGTGSNVSVINYMNVQHKGVCSA